MNKIKLQEKEYTIKELEEMIENAKKGLTIVDNEIRYKDVIIALTDKETDWYNPSTLARNIARVMDNEISSEDKVDCQVLGYNVKFDAEEEEFFKYYTEFYVNDKIFANEESAIKAKNLLNDYLYTEGNTLFGYIKRERK